VVYLESEKYKHFVQNKEVKTDIVVLNEFGSHLKVSSNDEGTQTYLYTQQSGT
jgi:hypothetical protein